ncbi:hypothetical protein B0H17DRAFT_1144163 [Mycena rosella]|uniref:Uncharacterized protein n=1 Tax=Mycena rosella TaxID=1033263 RepID=A0AAD7G369_MYCRO|nr:hypothetical protein B0H17DRAFT_1144163 [Mycena rosella]
MATRQSSQTVLEGRSGRRRLKHSSELFANKDENGKGPRTDESSTVLGSATPHGVNRNRKMAKVTELCPGQWKFVKIKASSDGDTSKIGVFKKTRDSTLSTSDDIVKDPHRWLDAVNVYTLQQGNIIRGKSLECHAREQSRSALRGPGVRGFAGGSAVPADGLLDAVVCRGKSRVGCDARDGRTRTQGPPRVWRIETQSDPSVSEKTKGMGGRGKRSLEGREECWKRLCEWW